MLASLLEEVLVQIVEKLLLWKGWGAIFAVNVPLYHVLEVAEGRISIFDVERDVAGTDYFYQVRRVLRAVDVHELVLHDLDSQIGHWLLLLFNHV